MIDVGFLGQNVTQRKDVQDVETITAVSSSPPGLSWWASRGGGALCSCHWLDTEGRNSVLSLMFCFSPTVAPTALLLLLPCLVGGLSESNFMSEWWCHNVLMTPQSGATKGPSVPSYCGTISRCKRGAQREAEEMVLFQLLMTPAFVVILKGDFIILFWPKLHNLSLMS